MSNDESSGDFNLNDVLTTNNSDPDGMPSDTEEKAYEQAQQNNPELDEQAYSEAMGYVQTMFRIHRVRNKKGYQLASILTEFKNEELYRDLGYTSFNEYASDTEVCPFGRSSAYRYVKVGQFIDEHDVGSRDFDEQFYDEHNVERIIERDEDGNIDQEATRQANEVTARVNFMHMSKISGLYKEGYLNAAEAREMMAKAIILDPDDFELECREAKGEEEPTDTDDDLFYEGLKGTNLILPLGDIDDDDELEQNLDKAKGNLRDLLEAAENGELKDEIQKLRQEDDDVEKVASKSTKYRKTPDGRYYGTT